jgi:hypothetical protein
LGAIGRARKAKAGTGSRVLAKMVDKMPPFLAAENLKPWIDNELRESTTPNAGGSDGLENCEALCLTCHKKTGSYGG